MTEAEILQAFHNAHTLTGTETLQAFYNAYAKWLDIGAPEYAQVDGFQPLRNRGLCGNLTLFCSSRGVHYATRNAAEALMKQQFIAAGLDGVHPFESSAVYWLRVVDGSMHNCLNRIKWVQDHAN